MNDIVQDEPQMTVGVLALQGGFAAHQNQLNKLNVKNRLVKKPEELQGLSGLIIPGGESSTLLKLMAPFNWLSALRQFSQQGGAIFGTCAGMILLANEVSPDQDSLGLIDMSVVRNAYGRQQESFITTTNDVDVSMTAPLELVFIRAPKITRCGPDVDVLVSLADQPVMVRQGNAFAASFHPELSDSPLVHQIFVRHCQQALNRQVS